eukprot:comp22473_c0_seq1/m.55539 comp22473_c0_seq1/g.55539  ORF comp22473_c0_seq1/g.55539 comp22473_c0_seq1/m.55539 type:complete len:454 (+) comp22473_c0_seq1:1009-2370(+)
MGQHAAPDRRRIPPQALPGRAWRPEERQARIRDREHQRSHDQERKHTVRSVNGPQRLWRLWLLEQQQQQLQQQQLQLQQRQQHKLWCLWLLGQRVRVLSFVGICPEPGRARNDAREHRDLAAARTGAGDPCNQQSRERTRRAARARGQDPVPGHGARPDHRRSRRAIAGRRNDRPHNPHGAQQRLGCRRSARRRRRRPRSRQSRESQHSREKPVPCGKQARGHHFRRRVNGHIAPCRCALPQPAAARAHHPRAPLVRRQGHPAAWALASQLAVLGPALPSDHHESRRRVPLRLGRRATARESWGADKGRPPRGIWNRPVHIQCRQHVWAQGPQDVLSLSREQDAARADRHGESDEAHPQLLGARHHRAGADPVLQRRSCGNGRGAQRVHRRIHRAEQEHPQRRQALPEPHPRMSGRVPECALQSLCRSPRPRCRHGKEQRHIQRGRRRARRRT